MPPSNDDRQVAAPAKRVHVGRPAGGRIRLVTALVVVAVLVVTGVLALAASSVNRSSNQRLLQLQVRQAAVVLTGAEPSLESQLADGLQIATATNAPSAFRQFAATKVRPAGTFASVSLWRRSSSGAQLLTFAGARPLLATDGRAASFFSRVHPSTKLQVTGIIPGAPPRLGYAVMRPGGSGLIVYAEGLLPADHKLVVPKSSAFGELNFALYLGSSQHGQLIESSVPTPVTGSTASATVPFGTSAITMVGTPTGDLAGALSAALPWIVLAAGLILALAGGWTLQYVLRRRQLAEELASENRRLYLEQRNIAGTLQHALLPELPQVEGLEAAARYLPGVEGVDVGGDWYDFICPEPGRCVVIVGDVSGRGLHAATTMASLRHATRAYVAESHDPPTVLTKLGDMLDFESHHQFATVLIGEVDIEERTVTLASAGHFLPLLVSNSGAEFVDFPISTPVGIDDPSRPEPYTVHVPKGTTLIAFTDGLVERRGEHLDVGLARLRAATSGGLHGPVEQMLDRLVATLIPAGGEDDVVILGFRWRS
ncbi:MAG: Two component signal transduction histidine kinase [Acidimicrobiaceae bacterium]|nr:Two component signal transduction histidine kinase [Acidimicrobiaceae bacterium]